MGRGRGKKERGVERRREEGDLRHRLCARLSRQQIVALADRGW